MSWTTSEFYFYAFSFWIIQEPIFDVWSVNILEHSISYIILLGIVTVFDRTRLIMIDHILCRILFGFVNMVPDFWCIIFCESHMQYKFDIPKLPDFQLFLLDIIVKNIKWHKGQLMSGIIIIDWITCPKKKEKEEKERKENWLHKRRVNF